MEEYEFMGDHSEEATASLAMNATISKDDTDISKQKALLSAKRAHLDLDVKKRNADRDDPDVHGGLEDEDSEEDEEDTSTQSSDGEDEDDEGSGDSDGDSAEEQGGEDGEVGHIPLHPYEEPEGIAKTTGRDIGNNAPAAMLYSQIQEKLASIPGLDLPNDGPHNQLIEFLTLSVAKLSAQNRMLKEALQNTKMKRSDTSEMKNGAESAPPATESSDQEKPAQTEEPAFEEVHMVRCGSDNKAYFRDVPRMFKGDRKSDHLRGRYGLENMTTYLKKHKHLAFVIVHHYTCSCAGGPDYHRLVGFKDGRIIDDSQPAEAVEKHVFFNKHVKNAILEIAKAHPEPFGGWKMAKLPRWSYEPHFVFYMHHKAFLELADSSNLSEFDARSIKLLCDWVMSNHKEDWDEADALFSQGKTSSKHYRKMFRPGELFLWQDTDRPGTTWVYKIAPYPWSSDPDNNLSCYRWFFNGHFVKTYGNLDLSFMTSPSGSTIGPEDGEVDITSVAGYPLRFAEPSVYNALLARGSKFWHCRKKKIISYNDPLPDGEEGLSMRADHRFMVDYSIFKRMHPRKPIFSTEADDLGSEAMNKKEPPDDDFLALLPPDIHAFDFSAKTWKLIKVEGITDVTWNKDAFKRLVLPKENKELIQAAVMAQGHLLSASPDIIAGKGQGLLILLHGGPGTGKTLTAESIAETQERPLYRVTCGDIGIEPTQVEQYLETVFTIGKAWGCVVLLDEADVFLEERTVTDQKQNAVVSVFLRLLEYYDGILILTTNRVGTFDEAFKSRIHLALRYENLNQEQRVEIWRNLIDMLKDFTNERVDTGDLLMNVNKLAREELNGRQIRNVITLARYLAKFRGEILVYKHVQDALASVVKFDQYLLGLRGSDDHFATEQRLR